LTRRDDVDIVADKKYVITPWDVKSDIDYEKFGAKLYFQFTDDKRLLIRPEFSEKDTNHWINENVLDVLALGFDPNKLEFIVNLQHASKIYPIALKIARKTTASTAKGIFGFNDSSLQGLMFFPAMQAAPCFLESEREGRSVPCLIPAGIDQDPYWRMTRDVA